MKQVAVWLHSVGKALVARWPELLLVTGGLVAVGVLWHGSCWGVHPSDTSMIAFFEEHEAEFQALAHADQGLESSHRQAMDALGVQQVYSVPYLPGAVEFVVSTQGLSVSGSAKGYLYSPSPPENLVENTGTAEARYGPVGIVYRRIASEWYIFYEWDS